MRQFKVGDTVKIVNAHSPFYQNKIGKVIEYKNKMYFIDYLEEDGKTPSRWNENSLALVEDKPEFIPRPKAQMPQNIHTLHDAIKFELESKKPRYEGQAALWFKEGRCPQCGQLGRYSLSVATCSEHGEY